MVQGVTPGPLLIIDHPDVFWGVIASMYIGGVMLLILNLPLVGLWIQLLKVPFYIMGPAVLLITAVGCYSLRNSVYDLYLLLVFGIIGYVLRKLEFETGPLLMAFILAPLIENSLRQSLLMSSGDIAIFFTRPISGILILIFAIVIIFRLLKNFRNVRKGSGGETI